MESGPCWRRCGLACCPELRKSLAESSGTAVLIVVVSVFVIDLGYGFEGVGIPLGKYDFACQTLTRPVPPGVPHADQPRSFAEWRASVPRQSLSGHNP